MLNYEVRLYVEFIYFLSGMFLAEAGDESRYSHEAKSLQKQAAELREFKVWASKDSWSATFSRLREIGDRCFFDEVGGTVEESMMRFSFL